MPRFVPRRFFWVGCALFPLLWGRPVLAAVTPGEAIEEEENDTAVADTTAPANLPASSSPFPFPLKEPTPAEIEAFQTAWRRALLAFRSGNYVETARRLRKAEASERLAQVYRTSFFVQACLRMGMRPAADSALAATLSWVKGAVWLRHLYTLRLLTFDFDHATPSALKKFCLSALAAPLDPMVKTDLSYRLLRMDSLSLGREERLVLTRKMMRWAAKDARLDSAYQGWAIRFPPGQGDWSTQKLLLDWEVKLGNFSKAQARIQALLPLAPGKSERQGLQWLAPELDFRRRNFSEALKGYSAFQAAYGDSPDFFLQMARTYEQLSDSAKAKMWFSLFTEKYPHSLKTSEIYWLRGFEAESEGRNAEAVELYARQPNEFPNLPRASWAIFRMGLVYYKGGNYGASLPSFQALREGVPSNPTVSAGLYWEAKDYEALKDTASMRKALLECAARFPFNFYGHLARFELKSLQAWPDSLAWKNRFSSQRASDAKAWLARYAPGTRDTIAHLGESQYLPLSKLVQWSLDSLAMLTYRNLSNARLGNPWALFVDARRCQEAGYWADAARLGARLANLLPIENWATAPRSVLHVIYPRAYEGFVRRYAAEAALPSALVFALIKQESGFDARIESHAGARGLMQMMPATGVLQANREGMNGFNSDSLFNPGVNVRLGVAFLRDVVARYQGNLYFALAHYNAGPVAVRHWMQALVNKPPDEAVEDIGYWETRDYVKRVLANYWTYQEMEE